LTTKSITKRFRKSKAKPKEKIIPIPLEEIAKQTEPPKRKIPPYHPAGLIKIDGEDILPPDYNTGIYEQYTPEQVRQWTPQYNIVPYNKNTKKPLSASELKSTVKGKAVTLPKYFMNPYQDLDYMVLQDIYANTIAGRIIDKLVELIFGNGIKPILKLRNPDEFGDLESQQQEIESNQEIINDLLAVDEALSDPDNEDEALETDVNSKFMAMTKNALVFGRCCIIKEFLKPVTIEDGRKFAIPNVLKVMHPRDIDIVNINPQSWKLESVNIRFTQQDITPKQMIYLENVANNPVFNSMHYGYSAMQSMIGASRSLRQLIEVDFPTITKHIWAGLGFLFFKPEGTTQAEKDGELNTLLSQFRAGRLNGAMINPEDVKVEFLDLDPKISELVTLGDFLIRYNTAQIGIPQGLFSQEKDSNRATLIGKLRFFMTSVVKAYQDWVTRSIAKQWYMPNFKAIYGADSKVLKKFKIECVFEELKLENFMDTVDAVSKLNQMIPLTAEAIGELTDIDEFEDKIDPDVERPVQQPGLKMKDSQGKEFSLEN